MVPRIRLFALTTKLGCPCQELSFADFLREHSYGKEFRREWPVQYQCRLPFD